MNKRCLLVSSFMAEYKGSYICSIIALVKKMHENGDEVVFVFPKAKTKTQWIAELEDLGCKIYFLEHNPYSFNNISFIKKLVKKEKINLIYSDFTGWDITVKLAKPFMPTIWFERMRVNDVDTDKKILNIIKYRIIGAFKTYPVGISDDVHRALKKLSGKECDKIINALDVSRFNIDLPRAENSIKKYLMFSYTPIVKGVDIVCDAMEKLNEQSVKAKLMLVSHGACNDYINERYPVIPEWLELLSPRDDVDYFYRNADCFISASRSEGFCQALIESLYMGLSAIASDIPGTAWSKEFQGVTYFESANAESLLEVLQQNQSLKISKEEVAFNQKKVAEKYSLDVWVQKVIDIQDKALKG